MIFLFTFIKLTLSSCDSDIELALTFSKYFKILNINYISLIKINKNI